MLSNPNISALLWAGYPGQSGGTAIFSLLTGASAPAARLPVTQYPARYVDDVPLTDMSLRPSDKSPGRTYRWYKSPVFPFGFGLHYTTFNASLGTVIPAATSGSGSGSGSGGGSGGGAGGGTLLGACTAPHPDLCPFATVPIRVTNTGNTTSDYVALVFVSGEYGPRPYPLRTLAGYTRLRGISPGQTVTGSVELTVGNLARVDWAGNTVLYPGRYKLVLDTPGVSEVGFDLAGEEAVLDYFPQPGSGGKNATRAKVWKLAKTWRDGARVGMGTGLKLVNVTGGY